MYGLEDLFMYDKLVLAIPHSTRVINTVWSDPSSVGVDADRWTDWFTDKMFGAVNPQIEVVKGDVSRFDCDLERLKDDPLEAIGQGILYTRSHSGATRVIVDEDVLLAHWRSYQDRLINALVNNALLIDCHSFPADVSNVDICIGFNDDISKPGDSIIKAIVDHFKGYGYSVGVNTPYSNSITPPAAAEYHSVMIELNKRIYFNELELKLKPFAYKVEHCVGALYPKLLMIK
jgi:N-formylglutamate amidohydrolase